MRNDGKYEIYIIKHLYKDDPNNEWSGSGECINWIPKEIIRKKCDHLIYGNGIFRPFTANGECWQQTGIYGSYDKEDAIEIINKISKWNPGHRFKVCKLTINQLTTDVVEQRYKL